MKTVPTYNADDIFYLLTQIRTSQGIQILYEVFHSESRLYSEKDYLFLKKAISVRRNFIWRNT